ncbi:helix-turn-helix transcriptional regulator [Serratia fonticola]|jgi:DNA-binding CsgD family transcriptional regulator
MGALFCKEINSFRECFPELSTTETQVLSLYAIGVSVKDIASRLGCSIDTVNTHLRNAKAKYSAEGFAELKSMFFIRVLMRSMNSTTTIQ